MPQEHAEQGGAATMDPSRLGRWLGSKVMTYMNKPGRLEKQEARAEQERVKAGLPHRLEYFHQVDDAYSHLAAQALRSVLQHYQLELVPHLVRGPSGGNLPEPDLLPSLARYDAGLVAPHYGLNYPPGSGAPEPKCCALANQIIAAALPRQFPEIAVAVGEALCSSDEVRLEELAAEFGSLSPAETEQALDRGTARRGELKHYAGGMFYYGGQWYWGVDRLYLLERRLLALGCGHGELLFPRPAIEVSNYRDNGSLTLEFYASLRSPYTALIFDKAIELAERSGVRLELRPVLPMVMRGVSLTREKGFYIMADAAREARALGVQFGEFYDPIGEPARRCYSLFSWAREQGLLSALMSEFLRAAFKEGINTNRDSGLRQVVQRAGLSWEEAVKVIDNDDWQPELERNQQSMYDFGSWGVPTFRLLDANGETVVWAWGQDRLWLIGREIQRLMVQA